MEAMRIAAASLLIACVSSSTAGCSKSEPQQAAPTTAATPAAPAPPPPPPDPAAEAKQIFRGRCVVCHGDHGAGDGPGAAALTPKPRAFADPEWQASVTDEHIKRIVVEGGPAVGKSPGMAANPDLKGKDDVLTALVKIVRDFKK